MDRHPGPAVRHLLYPRARSTVLIPTYQRRRRRRHGSLNIWKQVGGSYHPLTLCRHRSPSNMWSTIVMCQDGSGGFGEDGKGAWVVEKTSTLKCIPTIPILPIPISTPHLVLLGTLIHVLGMLDFDSRKADAGRREKAKHDGAKTLVREEDGVQKSRTRSIRSEDGSRGSSLDSAQHQRVGLLPRLSQFNV